MHRWNLVVKILYNESIIILSEKTISEKKMALKITKSVRIKSF